MGYRGIAPGWRFWRGTKPPKAEHFVHLVVNFTCNFAHVRSECAEKPVLTLTDSSSLGDASPSVSASAPTHRSCNTPYARRYSWQFEAITTQDK